MFDLKKAAAAQARLASRLDLNWTGGDIHLVAGADCSYERKNNRVGAVIVVLELPGFSVLELSRQVGEAAIPYIPGYLNFREGPLFLKAFRKLKIQPDVTLVDGNGIAHPRKMGLASYLGVLLGISTIGCAKSAFFPFRVPPGKRGGMTPYKNREQEKVGFCLRTREGVHPIFVSPGNRIDDQTAMQCVLACSKFRIPEPIRYAHAAAKDLLK